ncbi:MAG: hypothetical protein ACLQAN_03155 [Acidimicrobiales bacterium]
MKTLEGSPTSNPVEVTFSPTGINPIGFDFSRFRQLAEKSLVARKRELKEKLNNGHDAPTP